MKSQRKNNQEIIKSQMITMFFSFVIFNFIVKDTEWLVWTSLILLIVLLILIGISGDRVDVRHENEKTIYSRRNL